MENKNKKEIAIDLVKKSRILSQEKKDVLFTKIAKYTDLQCEKLIDVLKQEEAFQRKMLNEVLSKLIKDGNAEELQKFQSILDNADKDILGLKKQHVKSKAEIDFDDFK